MVNNKFEVGKSSFTWSIHLRAVRVVSYTVWSTLHILSTFFGRCVEGGDGRCPLVGMDWKLTGRWQPFGRSSSSCELILSGFGRKMIFVRFVLKWKGECWVPEYWHLHRWHQIPREVIRLVWFRRSVFADGMLRLPCTARIDSLNCKSFCLGNLLVKEKT